MNRLALKIELIKLYRRWIDGDLSVKERALEIRGLLKEKKSEVQLLSVRGEIRGDEVIEQKALVEVDGEQKIIDLKESPKEEGGKTLFSELLGEDLVRREEQEEPQETISIPSDVKRVESLDELVEAPQEEIILETPKDERIETIIEDREKEDMIEKILNSTPKKVPEAPERKPQKMEMSEEDVKRIPEKHKSRFETIMNLISQIFKVFKK
ncbi:MAG: hypothetical protein QXD03_00215 [Candidatus Anstonellales archaeon]